MLMTIAIILAVLWFLGFFVVHLGSLVHLILVIALIVFVYNLLVGRRRV
ncbi:MAG: lmo0937 family membrane protein [Candidatus Saccharibacteria bacterium]